MSEELTAAPSSGPQSPKKKRPLLRIGLVVLLAVAFWVVARLTGLDAYLTKENVQALMERAGPWGFLLFIVIFTIGEIAHVPGMVFVGAALFVFDRFTGTALALVGAVIAATVSFIVVRKVGGQALAEIERPFMKKILARLDRHPIRTIAVLRLIFWLTPAINYALAMTRVKLRDYVIGTTIGLVPPILLVAFLFDYVLTFLEWLGSLFG